MTTTATRTSRILVADDHELMRRGMRVLLEAQPNWSVVGEAVNGREAVHMARELKPDVVILDITMPDVNGLEAARRILSDNPSMPILMFTMHSSKELVTAARDIGARGYLMKAESGSKLIDAVDALLHHQTYFGGQARELT